MTTFLDRALAQRLEGVDAEAGIRCHEALLRLRPDCGAAMEQLAGGTIVFAGAQSPLTRARGLGMAGPVTEDEMDRLEHFFRSRGTSVSLEICPYTDPTLLEHLARRGYRVDGFFQVLVRPITPGERAPAPPDGVGVARAAPEDAGAWARLVAQGFAGAEEVTTEAIETEELLFAEPRATCFWAYVDGRPAAGGAMAVHGGLAPLFGTSTLPEFRGRGAQRALLEARIAHAAAQGCDLAMVMTSPGSTSQRNVERAGFRVIYTRVSMEKRWT